MSATATALRRLRLARAWSQEQLGDIAGISARTVQRLENGHAPSLETLKALAAALDVPVAELQTPERDRSHLPEVEPMHTPTDPHSFRRHLLVYAVVIGGLAAFNLVRGPEHPWVLYPALGWGIALAVKFWRTRRAAS